MIPTPTFPDRVRGVLCDLDGVLYIDDELIDGAVAAVAALKEAGVACRFVTNTTTRSHQTLMAKIGRLGLAIRPEEVLTPPRMAATMLREAGPPRVRLVCEADTAREFDGIPIDDVHPEAIVIGHYGRRWNYDLMQSLFDQLMSGARLIALHKGRYWQAADGLALDIGAFVAGLEHATGVTATVVGKPSSTFFEQALKSVSLKVSDAIMVGDDLVSDIGGAQALGIAGVLVRTGKFRAEQLEREGTIRPTHVIDSITALPHLIGIS